MSRAFNEILDRENYIDDQYIFEVSSPGLTRPLKKEKDYEKSIGRMIEIKYSVLLINLRNMIKIR